MNAVTDAGQRWRISPVVATVIAVAWGLALAAEYTGRVQWIHHHHLVADHMSPLGSITLFLLAWQVHIAAMMLPSTLPMIGLFRRASARQPYPNLARATFLGGYLVVWTGFGVAAVLGDALAHAMLHQQPTVGGNPGLLAGGVILLAGAFQFSSLKDRCMEQCRHPAAFITRYYRQGATGGFSLGLRHGLFCLGCCWALMLIMFVVGIANLAWMVPLALLMLYEKVGPGGDRMVRPVGVMLTLLGVAVLVEPRLAMLIGMSH